MDRKRFARTQIRARNAASPVLLATAIAALLAPPAGADVTIEERSSTQLSVMGSIEVTSTTQIAGDKASILRTTRMPAMMAGAMKLARQDDWDQQIIRLDQGIEYELATKSKKYYQTSFEELAALHRQSLEQMQKMQSQGGMTAPQECDAKSAKSNVKRTGEKQSIAGIGTERVIVTAQTTCKDASTGDVCELALTLDRWLAPTAPGTDEVTRFWSAYASKLDGGLMNEAQLQRQARAMLAQYENSFGAALLKAAEVKGYPLKTTLEISMGGPQCSQAREAAAAKAEAQAGMATAGTSPTGEDMAAQVASDVAQREASATVMEKTGDSILGGAAGQLAGKLGSKLGGNLFRTKPAAEPAPASATSTAPAPAAATPAGLISLLTVTTEVTAITNSATGPFAVPAGYRKVDRPK